MGFAGSSVVWKMENRGLLIQTVIYFLITSVTMMPIAYIAHWMEHSLKGVFLHFDPFAVVYVIM